MYNAKIEVLQRTNKNGEPYEILAIYMEAKNGHLVRVHEVYMKEALKGIIEFVDSVGKEATDE